VQRNGKTSIAMMLQLVRFVAQKARQRTKMNKSKILHHMGIVKQWMDGESIESRGPNSDWEEMEAFSNDHGLSQMPCLTKEVRLKKDLREIWTVLDKDGDIIANFTTEEHADIFVVYNGGTDKLETVLFREVYRED